MELADVLLEVEVAAEALLTDAACVRLPVVVGVHVESEVVHLKMEKGQNAKTAEKLKFQKCTLPSLIQDFAQNPPLVLLNGHLQPIHVSSFIPNGTSCARFWNST